jgi:hypothetical protein
LGLCDLDGTLINKHLRRAQKSVSFSLTQGHAALPPQWFRVYHRGWRRHRFLMPAMHERPAAAPHPWALKALPPSPRRAERGCHGQGFS